MDAVNVRTKRRDSVDYLLRKALLKEVAFINIEFVIIKYNIVLSRR